MTSLRAEELTLSYGAEPVVEDLSTSVPEGAITSIIGPNGCGKSTLLRALGRLLKPIGGTVQLGDTSIFEQPSKHVATKVGLLPQSPTAPEGLTVEELVTRGRFPHQKWYQQWSQDDAVAVERALQLTATAELRDRPVDSLSGGQRQRVWIAMSLSQDTPIMLLDEPTTYLDLAHQVEVLDLLSELNEERGTTIVMVLHELNLAARYADHIIAMRAGRIVASGSPRDIIDVELVRSVFGMECVILEDPVAGTPLCLPSSYHRRGWSRPPGGAADGLSETGRNPMGTVVPAASGNHGPEG